MKCKIETLTPCHIGSGIKLVKDIDFVSNGQLIGVISTTELYKLLGDEGIDDLCAAIQSNESIWGVIQRYNSQLNIETMFSRPLAQDGDAQWSKASLFSRTIKIQGVSCRELSEHIASNGVPYIPGSSIKGAIVSAIVGACREKVKLPSKAKDLKSVHNIVAEQVLVKPTEKKDGKIVYDPKNSNLRFLRVGDAYFDGADSVAIESYSLNLRERQPLIDKSANMLVESIDKGCEATFDLQLRADLHQVCGDSVLPLPDALHSEENLFAAINSQTLRLLEEELLFWEEQKGRDYYHLNENDRVAIESYLKSIQNILNECARCRGYEAVLRIGYGSGWNFTTGGWIDRDDDMWDKVLSLARPEPTKRGDSEASEVSSESRYAQYDFPKTRRVGYVRPFGFVKISRLD